jgi:hypothetical protein
MNTNDDQFRRLRDECDMGADIKATVRAAQSFIENGLVTEEEALKYFNLPKSVYDKYKVHPQQDN